MAAPTHFSKAPGAALIVCLLGLGVLQTAQAQGALSAPAKGQAAAASAGVLTDADKAMVERSREASKALGGALGLDGLLNRGQNAANAEARTLLEQLRGSNQTMRDMAALERDKQVMQNYSTLVFASQSLGEQSLNEILRAAAGQPDTVVVLRGVPPGMKLGEGVLAVQQMAAAITPMPNVIINPTLFVEHKVTTVPTIVVLADKKDEAKGGEGRVVAGRVSGISDPAWLKREMAASNARRDFGKAGPVQEISEPDLIEVAKQKVMEIDWAEKKRQAQARFWSKQKFLELPPAPRSSTREFDPSIVLTDNIMAGDKIVAFKGTRINPLEMRDFTQALVVFDPLDKRQVKAVKNALPGLTATPGVQRITLIATRFDAALGWDSYKGVTGEFDAPVYLLTPDIASRFGLEHTPSIVTARNKKFQVREIGMGLH
ncbi:MAG: TrbC family F-type conjugative pilus assembly protein [Acidovorax sp.]|nr:TrbC family F-type conjugative pilus assembly protein [Acidovorax sp.]